MNSAFSSWTDFLAMGGYAFYVWLAVGFTLVPLLTLIIHSYLQHRSILKLITREHRRQHRINKVKLAREEM